MKSLIAVAFVAAICCAILSFSGVLSPTSVAPPLCFAAALVFVLLYMINVSDRRY